MKPWERVVRFALGHDVFVSYARLDGSRYAVRLAAALEERGLSCFLDQRAALRGSTAPAPLRGELGRASSLVLIASKAALASLHVEEEIREFVRSERPLTVAAPGATFETAIIRARERAAKGELVTAPGQWVLLLEGLVPVREVEAALDSGVPTADVVDRIVDSAHYTRRSVRQRRALLGGLVGFAAIILAGLAVTSALTRDIAAAGRQLMQANKDAAAAVQHAKGETARADQAVRAAASAIASASASASSAIAEEQKQLLSAVGDRKKAVAERVQADKDAKAATRAAAMASGQAAVAEQARVAAVESATSAKTLSSALGLASRADAAGADDPELRLRLALEATKVQVNPDTTAALRRALANHVPSVAIEMPQWRYPLSSEVHAFFAPEGGSLFAWQDGDEHGLFHFAADQTTSSKWPEEWGHHRWTLANGRVLFCASVDLAIWDPVANTVNHLDNSGCEPISRAEGGQIIVTHTGEGRARFNSIAAWTDRGDGIGSWRLDGVVDAAESVPNSSALVALDGDHVHLLSGGTGRRANASGLTANADAHLRVSPDGKAFAFASETGVQVWSTVSLKQVCTIPNTTDPESIKDISFSADGRLVAVVALGRLSVRPVISCEGSRALSTDGTWAGAEFAPKGDRLLAWQRGVATIWEPRTRDLKRQLKANGHHMNRGVFDTTGCHVATSDERGVRVWNVCAEPWATTEVLARGYSPFLQLSPDGASAVLYSNASMVLRALLGPRRGHDVFSHAGDPDAIFSPNGRFLTVFGKAVEPRIIEAASGGDIPLGWSDKKEDIRYFAVDDDAKSMVVVRAPTQAILPGPLHGWVAVLERTTGQVLAGLDTQTWQGTALTSDGETVAVNDESGVRLWHWRQDKVERLAPSGETLSAWSIAFSSDGRFFAAMRRPDDRVVIFRLSGSEPVNEAFHETEPVEELHKLSFSRDGRFLLTAASTHVDVWDSESAQPVYRIDGTADAESAEFESPTRIVSAWSDGTLRHEECTPCRFGQDLIARAEAHLKMNSLATILTNAVSSLR